MHAASAVHRYYVSGTIPLIRAPALARKFVEVYGVDRDKNERYRRKAAGLGNARLVLGLINSSMKSP